MYMQSNGSSSGIPRAAPGNTYSPPMQQNALGTAGSVSTETRTIGRHGLPPPGNLAASAASRRRTIAPSTQGYNHSRLSEGGAGSLGLSGGDHASGTSARASNQGLYRSKTLAPRPPNRGGAGSIPMPPVPAARSNMSDILERSNKFANSYKNTEDSDEDLERVVRNSGQGGLVNAYGIPVRPTTGHSKRTSSDRKSLAGGAQPHSMRPNTAHRSSRGDSGLGISPGRESLSNLNDKIRVCVRKRPLNAKEKEKGEKDIVPASGRRSLSVMEPKVKVDMTKYIEESRFVFDEVFSETADNVQVYERTAKPLVEYIFSGGNATCFAYGQTGSGKTYTMMDMHCGLYIQAAEDIFGLLELSENKHLQAFVTFYEIYLTNLFDLLNDRKKLFAREDANQNVCIQGIREVLIQSPEDLMSVFEYGNNCRSTGSTGANADSSRSHAILQIALKDMSKRKPVQLGKLSFIDLAGNERGSDRGDKADKQTMMEGSEINKSLLALKECIRALDLNKKHQPFRQSKLTQVLKDSFIGNSRACMVATISPNISNSDNTLNTLRYADRVKAMKSSGVSADTSSPVSESQRETDDYYSNEYDANYEDDSGDRAYDEGLDSAYSRNDSRFDGYSGRETGYHRNSRDMLREEDAFAEEDEIEDDNAVHDDYLSDNIPASTDYGYSRSYQQHQDLPPPRQQLSAYQGGRRGSYEEKLEHEIAVETPSILDEQPSFLDEGRQSARAPHVYGSPAAKGYVSSRLTKSPVASRQRAPSKLASMLMKSKKVATPPRSAPLMSSVSGGSMQQQQLSEEEDGAAGGLADSGLTRRVTRAYSRKMTAGSADAARDAYLPAAARTASEDPTSMVSYSSRHRANTQSSSSTGDHQQQREASPYTSALSLPSEANSPSDGQYGAAPESLGDVARMAEKSDVDGLLAPFGGLKIADVDSLVKRHRSEIRSTTEACKEETMLISAYTTFSYAQLVQQSKNKAAGDGSGHSRSTSWQHQQSQSLADKYHLDVATGAVTRLTDGIRFETVEQAKMNEAIEYLEKLDEVLARKQQLVVDLRAEIRKLVWESTNPPPAN
ncbi:kinesin-domain-containing protein [Martensiomyces pterosporus]|nr:kinesin-domain-containing protein [Martensiomyces pterosporus]